MEESKAKFFDQTSLEADINTKVNGGAPEKQDLKVLSITWNFGQKNQNAI